MNGRAGLRVGHRHGELDIFAGLQRLVRGHHHPHSTQFGVPDGSGNQRHLGPHRTGNIHIEGLDPVRGADGSVIRVEPVMASVEKCVGHAEDIARQGLRMDMVELRQILRHHHQVHRFCVLNLQLVDSFAEEIPYSKDQLDGFTSFRPRGDGSQFRVIAICERDLGLLIEFLEFVGNRGRGDGGNVGRTGSDPGLAGVIDLQLEVLRSAGRGLNGKCQIADGGCRKFLASGIGEIYLVGSLGFQHELSIHLTTGKKYAAMLGLQAADALCECCLQEYGRKESHTGCKNSGSGKSA